MISKIKPHFLQHENIALW